MNPTPGIRSMRLRVALPLALAILVLAIYGRTGAYPFIKYDDEAFVSGNPVVREGLTLEGVRWAFTTDMDAGWIPLTWLSRMADVSLFGMDAGGHHLVNVLFHLANVLLLFHALRRMTGRPWESGFVAALFAVHPLHVESVAWVTERKDVLAGFFWMLSLWAYARYSERPGLSRYLAVALCFALGLMSKPIVVTLPFVLLLLDFWPLGRLRLPGDAVPEGAAVRPAPWRRLVLEKAPLLAMSAAASAVTILFQQRIGAVSSLEAIPIPFRAANALQSYVLYLWKTAWPARLSVFYPHPGSGISPVAVAASALLLAAVTALALCSLRSRRWLAVGWFWYLGTLVPVIGLVNVGGKSMADRCAYLPLIGIYAAMAFGFSELARRWRISPKGTALLAGALILSLSARSIGQAEKWRGTGPLFRDALEATGENWLAQHMLGLVAYDEGKDAEAIARFREAVRIWPDLPEVRNAMGRAFLRSGDSDSAIEAFREELRIQPGFAEAWYNLGVALDGRGRSEEAIVCYRKALEIVPGHPEAASNLAVHLTDLGRAEEAIPLFRAAIRRRPAFAEARHGLGVALAATGALQEAAAQLEQAATLRPGGYPEARNNLGTVLAAQGRLPEAIAQFREALRLKPGYEGAKRNLQRAAGEIRPPESSP